jgi:twitching motility protein PilT
MLQFINKTRKEHIITIEDPIEFVFTPDQCLISQREVGNDTDSFSNALRASMREDPDIIFVGEIRDHETAESVLRLAESGHLVFSTLHTPSAAFTINRFVSFFPPDIQASVCERLADIITGVQSQILVKTADESQRVGIFEVMFTTPAVRNNIKKRDIAQINSMIETSASTGMTSMKKYAQRLFAK